MKKLNAPLAERALSAFVSCLREAAPDALGEEGGGRRRRRGESEEGGDGEESGAHVEERQNKTTREPEEGKD